MSILPACEYVQHVSQYGHRWVITYYVKRGSGERVWPTWAAWFFFFLPHNEVGTESLCIRLINSYSSSAWHPGNRSGFALGLIFRPVEDSQSIRALFRRHTTNFPDRLKKWGDERENERVIEGGIDDIEGEMGGGGDKVERNWEGEKRWEGLGC